MPKQNGRRRPDTPPPSPPTAPPHYMMYLNDGSSSRPGAPSPIRSDSHSHPHQASSTPRDIDSDPPPRYEEAISNGQGPSDPWLRELWPLANRTPTPSDFHRHQRDHRALPSSSTFQRQPNSVSPTHRQNQQRASSRNQSQPPGCSRQSDSRHSRQSNSILSDASSGGNSPSGNSNRSANNRTNVAPRFRSASPSGLSTESQTDRSASTSGKRPKKNRGSKIKKGLENIAFFIIQVLD